MTDHEQALERRLLMLGRQELELETRMKQLRQRARESGNSGYVNDADACWNLFVELRDALGTLQGDIDKVERELYGLRRQRRK